MALADITTFVFALIAVDFSTWIVLPWAFYDDLSKRKETGTLRRLKRAQGFFFTSGLFFLVYATIFFATDSSIFTQVADSYLNTLGYIAFILGAIGLASGLILSFYVVNAYVDLGEEEIDLFRIIAIPFVIFIDLATFINIESPLLHLQSLNTVQLVVTFLLLFAIFGTWMGLAWMGDIPRGLKELRISRGLLALALLLLPWILLFILVG